MPEVSQYSSSGCVGRHEHQQVAQQPHASSVDRMRPRPCVLWGDGVMAPMSRPARRALWVVVGDEITCGWLLHEIEDVSSGTRELRPGRTVKSDLRAYADHADLSRSRPLALMCVAPRLSLSQSVRSFHCEISRRSAGTPRAPAATVTSCTVSVPANRPARSRRRVLCLYRVVVRTTSIHASHLLKECP